jgi:GNAT superfamily N-acetyltransferase
MIAEEEGRAIGYALVNDRQADDVRVTGPRFGVLQSRVVKPGRRGEGLGRALVRSRVRGATPSQRRSRDRVICRNEQARRFYNARFGHWAGDARPGLQVWAMARASGSGASRRIATTYGWRIVDDVHGALSVWMSHTISALR